MFRIIALLILGALSPLGSAVSLARAMLILGMLIQFAVQNPLRLAPSSDLRENLVPIAVAKQLFRNGHTMIFPYSSS